VRRPRGPIRSRVAFLTGRAGGMLCELYYDPRRLGVTADRWRVFRGGKWLYWPGWTEEYEVPKPIVPSEGDGLPALPRPPSDALGVFSEIHSFLTDMVWPDGTLVGDVQLSIRTRECRIVAQLKIAAHGGLRISAECVGIDEALTVLEAALNATPVPWERDPYPLGGAPKKKK